MRFLRRHAENPEEHAGDNGESDGALTQTRAEVDRLLTAGDEAIRRALAGGNSEAFIRSARQQGGQ